jgi:hypothetical protein
VCDILHLTFICEGASVRAFKFFYSLRAKDILDFNDYKILPAANVMVDHKKAIFIFQYR